MIYWEVVNENCEAIIVSNFYERLVEQAIDEGHTHHHRVASTPLDGRKLRKSSTFALCGVKVHVNQKRVSPLVVKQMMLCDETVDKSVAGVSTFAAFTKVYDDGLAMLEYRFTGDATMGYMASRNFMFFSGGVLSNFSPIDNTNDRFLSAFRSTKPDVTAQLRAFETAFHVINRNATLDYVRNLKQFNELTSLNYDRTALVDAVHVYHGIAASDDQRRSRVVNDHGQPGDTDSRFIFVNADLNQVDLRPTNVLTTLDATLAQSTRRRLLTDVTKLNPVYIDSEYAVVAPNQLYVKIDDEFYRVAAPYDSWSQRTLADYTKFVNAAREVVNSRRAVVDALTSQLAEAT